MKKILVTGATGFVGNHVVEELLSRGHLVIATSSHKERAATFTWYDKVTFLEFDLESFDEAVNYFEFFQQPDQIIHLAWQGLPNYKHEFHLTKNLPIHFSFLNNMLRNGLKDLTVSGTCFEYGMQTGCLSENMEALPANPYAIAKNKLRILLEELSMKYSFDLKWIRLFYLYGSGQNPDSLISQLDKALEHNEKVFNMSGGEQVRDYLPVKEAAFRLVSIATQNSITGIINCCSGKPITIREFIEEYLKKKGRTIQLNLGYYNYADYEPMEFWGDTKKLGLIIKAKHA